MKTTRALQFLFIGLFSVLVVIVTASAAEKSAKKNDLVILGGRVMDPESGFDGVRNVGVVDGRITVITKDTIEGKETIDAKGHVVAPGFIDIPYVIVNGTVVVKDSKVLKEVYPGKAIRLPEM